MPMIIWSRFGIVALVIPIILILMAQSVVPPWSDHDPDSVKRAKSAGFTFGALFSAAVLWPLGRGMNMTERRKLIDPKTGEMVEMEYGGGHTLFFIPIQYWAFIWIAIGLYRFFSS
jgi:hypothetical protein